MTIELYPYVDDPDEAARRASAARPEDPGHLMSDLRAYAQLVRLPNSADRPGRHLPGRPGRRRAAGALARVRCCCCWRRRCLYCGGMVWNDYFDVEQDRRERPFRPLPSGRIAPSEAVRLGIGLFAGGGLLLAGWPAGEDGVSWVAALPGGARSCSTTAG